MIINNNLRTIMFCLLQSALLVGCGSSGDTSTPSATTSGGTATIQGNAMLGPVAGATVTAYPVLASGALQVSNPLATTTTDSSGNYKLTLSNPPSGPIGVQLTGGSYIEEASGATVNLSSKTFTTLLSSVSGGATLTAAVGPLPDMAFQSFKSQVQIGLPSGTTLAQAASNANYSISQAFGISDVVGTIPANTLGTISNDAQGQYALIMAAISKAAQSAGTDSTAIADAYSKSFIQNGNFSAAGSSVSVTNASGQSITVSPPTLSSLATTVSQIGDGSVTLSGVTPPAGFTPPTFNAHPPNSAPSTYVPGSSNSTTILSPSPSPSSAPSASPSVSVSPSASPSVSPSTSPSPSPSPSASPSPLPAPSGFSISSAVAGNAQVTVTWSAASGASSYVIKYGTATGSYGTTFSSNATSPALVTGLTNGTQDFFMVIAVNAGGNTNANVEVTATPVFPVVISNIHRNNQLFESGFVVGTAIGGVAQVGCQIDGGTAYAATGTSNWKCQLPSGAAGWGLGSSHTISAGILSGSTMSSVMTYSIYAGHNRDINGDGYPDLVVGAPFTSSQTGEVYIYYGSSTGVTTTVSTTISGLAAGEWFGSAVALGDFNGDGYADLVVGASHNSSQAGVVYIFNGGSTGAATSPNVTIASPLATSGFGGSLAVGNIFAGGYTDLAVGAPYGSSVYEYKGTSGGLPGSPTTTLTSGGSDRFGAAVAIGNMFSSSYGDIFIGAPLAGGTNTGGVYLCRGTSAGSQSSQCSVNWSGVTSGEFFGSSVAIDFDTFGAESMYVGSPSAGANNGKIYFYYSMSTHLDTAGGTSAGVNQEKLGSSVGYFDLNGDGFRDHLTGAYGLTSIFSSISNLNPGASSPYYTTGSTFIEGTGADAFGYSIAQ